MIKIEFVEEFKRDLSEKTLSPPSGILLLKDKFIFSDEYNHRIQVCDRESTGRSFFFGAQGKERGNFFYPKGIASDSKGNIFIADCWNHRIQKLSPLYEPVLVFGKIGEGPGEFNEPFAVFPDKEDRFYVVDRCNHRVQLFDSDGMFLGEIGQRGSVLEEELAELYSTPKDLFRKPSFEFPNDISIDSSGNIYIVDTNNHRIVKLNSKGSLITAIGKKGEGACEFKFPYGITIDKNDLLFVSDMNNERIQILTPQGKFLGDYKGTDNKKITCPTSLRIEENRIYYSTGFDSSVTICKYEPLTLDALYSASSNKEISETIFNFLYSSEKGNYQGARIELTRFLDCSDMSFFLNLIKENTHFFALLLAPDSFPLFFDEKNSSTLFTLIEPGITHQKKEVRLLIDKRIAYARQILESRILNEQNIDQGSDHFDADLIRLEREERECFRTMRRELLFLKRLLELRGNFIKLLLNKYFASTSESGLKAEVLRESAFHTHDLLNYTLILLDERECYDAKREELFKDESRSKEQNMADFRYFSRLFDIANEVASIFVEIPFQEISSVAGILEKAPEVLKKEFVNALTDMGKDMALWELLTRLTVFTLMDLEPVYPSLEKKIKDFIAIIYDSQDLKNMNLDSDSDNKNSMLSDIFRVLFIESAEKKSYTLTDFFTPSDFDNSSEKLVKESFNAITVTLKEREKITEESVLTDIQLNGNLIRDEKLRAALSNRLVMLKFSERLKLKSLVSLFMTLRSNLIASLAFCDADKESEILLEELIARSIRALCEIPAALASSQLDKKEKLRLQQVDFTSKVILQNILDITSIIRDCNSSKEKKGFVHFKTFRHIKKDVLRGFEFKEPIDLTVDSGGNMLVLDTGSDRIFRISVEGKVLDSWGESGRMEGQFFNPTAISVNSKGEIFVSDGNNHRIQKFDKEGRFISFFGKKGRLDGEFNFPGRMAIDKDDTLFIVDQRNSRIQKFTAEGKFLFSFGKFGKSGNGEFQQPGGIAITKSRELIVGDYYSDKIQRFTLNGDYIGSFEAPAGEKFSWIVGICVDSSGRIFLSSFWQGKIWVFSDQYEFLGSAGAHGRGKSEFMGLSALCTAGEKIWACDYFGERVHILESIIR